MKVWLVTWESINQDHRIKNKIAGLLNPRWQDDRVKQWVEAMYINSECTLAQQLQYANQKRFNPFPARRNSSPFSIECGHNPWLEARKVSEFKVDKDLDGNEVVSWQEPMKNGESKIVTLTIKR